MPCLEKDVGGARRPRCQVTICLPRLGLWGKEQGPRGRAGHWQIAGRQEDRGHRRKAVEATNGQPPGLRGCLGARDSPGQQAGRESG